MRAAADALLSWYRDNGRSYPFRETSDPYRILVSEVMLRQTTARQVASLYPTFFSKYPSIRNLAAADPETVKAEIRPLGIVSRAYSLVAMAHQIESRHGGKVPRDMSSLLELPGVGHYAAACVMSFAYDSWAPMVDSNVHRVISRLTGEDGARAVECSYSEMAHGRPGRDLHCAIIDFSHVICRHRSPGCRTCPLSTGCARCIAFSF